jgi:mono/diheme cytochrome c family protein
MSKQSEQAMKSVSIRRVLVMAVAGLLVVGLAALGILEWRWRRHFDVPYPSLSASHDPALVARGEYLVYGAAACAYCHVPRDEWPALDRGEHLPLTGHHLFRLPFGEIYSANITPDWETGVGSHQDAAIARALQRGVRADGRAAFPLMEIRLADEDLVAVMSYLRARQPVSHHVPEHRLSLLGKAIMAFAITPSAPAAATRVTSPSGPTVERGEYLANDVSSCVACHTDRSEDGSLAGPRFAGGQRMDVAADATRVYVTPNLTPDSETSVIGQWSEDSFVARFRAGAVLEGTPMPWGAFARMTDDDLRAIYRYLRSLPPTKRLAGPPIQKKAAHSD